MPASTKLEDHFVVTSGFIPASAWALVGPRFSPFALETLDKVAHFVLEECQPAASTFHDQIRTDDQRWKVYPSIIEDLKVKARKLGLWNLFLSKEHYPDVGVPLTNLEYAVMAEIMGHAGHIAPEAMNCAAPDTGNMEVLARYGNQAQKDKWLKPLLEGKTRSAFAMTEPGVASSDATNIRTSLRIEGDDIVINGRKWWISGAGDPRCALHILMGKSDTAAERHSQQSIVIVPADTPGITLVRPMLVFSADSAPEGHMEIIYDNVRIPKENLVAGWGRGFEIIQGRLGPGRIHHCMRSLGVASRALELSLLRATDSRKVAFGKVLADHGTVVADIARSRTEIDQARLLVLATAVQIDLHTAKGALKEIGMCKAIVPSMVGDVIDRALQLHGAEGVCQDTPLAGMWASTRTLRIADGPDAVHWQQVGQRELRRAPEVQEKQRRLTAAENRVRSSQGLGPVTH